MKQYTDSGEVNYRKEKKKRTKVGEGSGGTHMPHLLSLSQILEVWMG